MKTNRLYRLLLSIVTVAFFITACSSPEENGVTGPANNSGIVVFDTIDEPVIPVSDQATKTLTADLSGIDEVVDGKLENVIITCSNLAAYDYPLAVRNINLDAWVLLNEGEMHITNGLNTMTFKHSLEEIGLTATDYVSDDFIFSFKTINIKGLTPGYFAEDFKIYVVVSRTE